MNPEVIDAMSCFGMFPPTLRADGCPDWDNCTTWEFNPDWFAAYMAWRAQQPASELPPGDDDTDDESTTGADDEAESDAGDAPQVGAAPPMDSGLVEMLRILNGGA